MNAQTVPRAARSIAKGALAALVDLQGTDYVSSPSFQEAADFIRGDGTAYLPHNLRPDTRHHLCAALAISPGQHALAVSASQSGAVAVFVYFGILPIWVCLRANTTLKGTLCHRVDPVVGTHETVELGETLPFDSSVLTNQSSPESSKEALGELRTLTTAAQQRAWINQSIGFGAEILTAVPERVSLNAAHLNEAFDRIMDAIRLQIGYGLIENILDGDEMMRRVTAILRQFQQV